MKVLSIVLVSIAYGWAAALGAAEDSARTVTVTGTALVRVAPDAIVWSIHLSTEKESLLEAKRENDGLVKRVIALRDELGVAKEDFATGQLRVHREYERDRNGRATEFRGFVVSRDITIRQRDLAKFDTFLDKLASRAEFEGSFEFESSRLVEAKNKARLQALKAAEEKALALARTAGAQGVVYESITENAVRGGEYTWNSNLVVNRVDTASSGSVDVADSTMIPEAIEVQVGVTAVFKMRG